MSLFIVVSDGIAVSLFGSILSASFCDALNTRLNRIIFWLTSAAILLFQGFLCLFCDIEFLRQIYPFVTHLPIIILLTFLTKNLLWSVISVFSAYLCCQLRRWLALISVTFFTDNPLARISVQLIITLPLLLLILHFVTPAVRKLTSRPAKLQVQFGIIPALYYIFDYLTVIYTDLLISGNATAVEFMPFVCCVAYLGFLLYYSDEEQKKLQLQQTKIALSNQINQSVREISALRKSQELTKQYRHDLRHHLQYVSTCIENKQESKAQSYIAEICQDIESQKVQQFCENEVANLILSSYVGRAKKDNIVININGTIPCFIKISDSDLCVLLSNALENAIHACQNISSSVSPLTIDVTSYERAGKFFLQIINPCTDNIRFKDGVPVSDRLDHGIGVESICAIVNRYCGIYSFTVENNRFILRVSI